MGNTTSTAAFLRAPIVDPKTGLPSRDFLKFLQYLVAKTDTTLELDGTLASDIQISGDTSNASLLAKTRNLDANGIILANGVDLSRAYTNKNQDNIPDGATYSRVLGSYVASGIPYNYKGAWNSATAYNKGDEVSDQGNYWLALANNTNSEPAIGNGNWTLLGPTSLDHLTDGTGFHRSPSNITQSHDVPYNGSFEIFPSTTVADGWQSGFETIGAGGTFARSTSAYAGTYSQEIQISSSANGDSMASRPISVVGGKWYRARLRVMSSVANPGSLYFRLLWYSDDNDLSRFSASLISFSEIVSAGGPSAASTWQLFDGSLQAPAGARFCRVALYNYQAACNLWFDTCSFGEDVTDTGSIQNNAVNQNGEFSNDTGFQVGGGVDTSTGSVTISTNGGNVEIWAKLRLINNDASARTGTIYLRKDSVSGTTLDTFGINMTASGQYLVVLAAIDTNPAASQTYYFVVNSSAVSATTSYIRIVAANRKR